MKIFYLHTEVSEADLTVCPAYIMAQTPQAQKGFGVTMLSVEVFEYAIQVTPKLKREHVELSLSTYKPADIREGSNWWVSDAEGLRFCGVVVARSITFAFKTTITLTGTFENTGIRR